MSHLYADECQAIFGALLKTISSICYPEDDRSSLGCREYYYGQIDKLFVAQFEEGYDNGWDEEYGLDFMPTCISLDSEFAKDHEEELFHLVLGYLIFEKFDKAGMDKRQVVEKCNEIVRQFFEQLD